MAVLYVETNLLIAAATNRDPKATILLATPYPRVEFLVPGICFFEAVRWFDEETKRRRAFGQLLDDQLIQLRRDTSGATESIVLHLEMAIVQNEKLLEFTGGRFDWAVDELSNRATILPITALTVAASFREQLIPKNADNLILHCILEHARSSEESDKALLTENWKDFDRKEAKAALAAAGVIYFSKYDRLFDWLKSRGAPDPGEAGGD